MKSSDYQTEINRAPALRISNVVYGRENNGTRVKYLVDPGGKGERKEIPENVVLLRWRKRHMQNHKFRGIRLSPNLWRALGRAYGKDASKIIKLKTHSLEKFKNILDEDSRDHHLKVPSADILMLLIQTLGQEKLQKILNRHLDPTRQDRFGTPDLFLFAEKLHNKEVSFYRLVEVKRPKERISKDQHEEIDFLRSIGVPARVLRLIERER